MIELKEQESLMQQALAELELAIKPFENSLLINSDLSQYYHFLHLLWAEFHIYIIEPFGGDDEGGSGAAKMIPLANGRTIFDYHFALSTSVGEDYGSYCQGKLYETIQEMVAMLAQRGVKKVSLIGNSHAVRVAWIECVEKQIETANYEPNTYDFSVRNRFIYIKTKLKKLQAEQELRL